MPRNWNVPIKNIFFKVLRKFSQICYVISGHGLMKRVKYSLWIWNCSLVTYHLLLNLCILRLTGINGKETQVTHIWCFERASAGVLLLYWAYYYVPYIKIQIGNLQRASIYPSRLDYQSNLRDTLHSWRQPTNPFFYFKKI